MSCFCRPSPIGPLARDIHEDWQRFYALILLSWLNLSYMFLSPGKIPLWWQNTQLTLRSTVRINMFQQVLNGMIARTRIPCSECFFCQTSAQTSVLSFVGNEENFPRMIDADSKPYSMEHLNRFHQARKTDPSKLSATVHSIFTAVVWIWWLTTFGPCCWLSLTSNGFSSLIYTCYAPCIFWYQWQCSDEKPVFWTRVSETKSLTILSLGCLSAVNIVHIKGELRLL